MLRSLCGCRTNRVDDKDVIVVEDYRNTVFLYTSNKVLSRSLVGALLTSLEKMNLKLVQAAMISPSQEILKKSAILKKVGRQKEVCLISLWRGDDSFKHVHNAATRFCREYAFVLDVDIAMTESTKSTRKEAELWIPTPASIPTTTITPADNVGNAEPITNEQPPNLEEEILAPAGDVDPAVILPNVVQDPEDVILVRESSTADTVPVGDTVDRMTPPNHELPELQAPEAIGNHAPAPPATNGV
ncbi:hypothetical protein V3C99_005710 [Haemonchus contortus]